MKKIFIIFCFTILLTSSTFAQLSVEDENFFEGDDNPIVNAIKAKSIVWTSSFKKITDAEKNLTETMEALEDGATQRKEVAENITIEDQPDIGNEIATKAAEASQWKHANEQVDQFTGLLDNSVANKISSDETPTESSIKTMDKLIPTLVAEDNGDIENPLSNANTLFGPDTYGSSSSANSATSEEAEDALEAQLTNAVDFSQLVINPTKDLTKKPSETYTQESGYSQISKQLTKNARKSLSYNGMNYITSMRTNIVDGGLGTYLKDYMSQLDEDTKLSNFKDVKDNINDDVSKYEFMNTLFSTIYMNPSWYVSLEKLSPKALRRRKIELFAFINMLNWENSKMLEKINALSAAELAIKNK